MKQFEVNIAIIGGSKDQIRKVFVSAKNKEEIETCANVLQIWKRKDIKPDECPMQVKFGSIAEK